MVEIWWIPVGLIVLMFLAVAVAFLLDWVERRSGIPRLTPEELAAQLEALAESEGWEERDLVDELDCVPIRDPRLDAIRERVIQMLDEKAGRDSWFSGAHRTELRRLALELRTEGEARTGA